MNRILIFLSTLVVFTISSGCSATWDGVVEDTGNMYDATKEAIHDATE